MVEQKKYTRNSLQTRLERSRRYRSRGGIHHDAVSVGDESVASMDNTSVTSASIDPSMQSKKEDSIKQESAKEEPIETNSSRGDTSAMADSESHLGQEQDKQFLRRNRLTQRTLKCKRTGLPQSPPTKVEAPAILSNPEKKMNQILQKPVTTLKVSPSKSENKKFPKTNAAKKDLPSRIKTQEPKDLDQDPTSQRHFQSPKSQVTSPCESMVYQASAMEEDCEIQEKSSSVLHPPTRKNPAAFFSNRGPSALQNWKSRERKEPKLDSSAGASSNSRPRSTVEDVIPKASHGLTGIKQGSDTTSYRRSLGETGLDKSATDQVLSTKSKDSREAQFVNKPRSTVEDVIPKVVHGLTGAKHGLGTSYRRSLAETGLDTDKTDQVLPTKSKDSREAQVNMPRSTVEDVIPTVVQGLIGAKHGLGTSYRRSLAETGLDTDTTDQVLSTKSKDSREAQVNMPRSTVEDVIPKVMHGLTGAKHGSGASYRRSLAETGLDTDTTDQVLSTKSKVSREAQVNRPRSIVEDASPNVVHGLTRAKHGSGTSYRRSLAETGLDTDTTDQVSSTKLKDAREAQVNRPRSIVEDVIPNVVHGLTGAKHGSGTSYRRSFGKTGLDTDDQVLSTKPKDARELQVNRPRSTVEDVIPKVAHGLTGAKHGSNTSYRRSLGETGKDTDTTDQMLSTKSKDSREGQVYMAGKSTQSVQVLTGQRQTPQSTQHHRQRHSTGGANTVLYDHRSSKSHPTEGNMYKNVLKPVRRETDGSTNPTQEPAFGGVIETPKRVTVSSLLASFDSRKNQPLMPMNSTDPRVRHSLPFPGGASVPKKTNHDLSGKVKQKRDGEPVEQSRKVVYCPPTRNSISTSKKTAVNPLQPVDPDIVRSEENLSHSLNSVQLEITSPTRKGVAERYRTVTGRNNQEPEPEPENHLEDDEVENHKTKKMYRTHRYYKASWRVQTHDFDEEKKNSDATDSDRGTLSPRQSVLSSWNQRYREQIQAPSNTTTFTPNDSSSTENHGTHKLNLPIEPESDHPEKSEHQDIEREPSQDSQSTQHTSQGSQNTPGLLQEPSHKVHKVDCGGEPQQKDVAANASIFSTWQQRERKHQPLATLSARRFEFSFEAQETDESNRINSEASTSKADVLGENKEAPSNVPKKIHHSSNFFSQGKATDCVRTQIGFSSSRRSLSKDEMSRDRHPSFESADELNAGSDSRSSDAKDAFSGSSSQESESLGKAAGTYEVAGVVKSSWSDTTSEKPEVSSSQQCEKKTVTGNDQNSVGHPWGKSTKQNIVHSWKVRSSKTKEVKQLGEGTIEKYPPKSKSSDESKGKVLELDSGRVTPFNSTEILDEKKSEDLSVNEDRILGVDSDDDPLRDRTRTSSSIDHENSFDPKSSSRQLIYDYDSYISDGGSEKEDTVSSEILPLPPKPTKNRSHESSTDIKKIDSEDISLYVEDEFVKTSKSMAFSEIETEIEQNDDVVNAKTTLQESPASKQGPLRIHPSPKDTKKYRLGYFGDESLSSNRGSQKNTADFVGRQAINKNETPSKETKTSRRRSDILDVWAVSSVSEDDLDDDIQFDETDKWLTRDQDINDDAVDDSSILSEPKQHRESSLKPTSLSSSKIAQKTFTTFDNLHDSGVMEREDVGIPVLDNPNTWNVTKLTTGNKMDNKKNSCSDGLVPFDPFHDEADDGKKVEKRAELFSPCRDPFMTEESFSPLDWSSPRGTTAQHIGYYNSPDSRLEI
jgi:hypothetical protein